MKCLFKKIKSYLKYRVNGDAMTCKDCIHYEVCERKDGTNTYNLELPSLMETKENNFIDCGNFKNKSKFIELPCEVGDNGDIFWAIDTYDISPYQCLGIKYGYDCIEGDNTIMLLAVGGREYIFGKEAFLTAEEAEQALKEREND